MNNLAIVKAWIKALKEEEPGEFWMEIEDMAALKEALESYVSTQSNELSIKLAINGVNYAVKKEV